MDNKEHKILITLGSNVAEKRNKIYKAIDILREDVSTIRITDIYETEPLSGQGAKYANAIIIGATMLSYETLETQCKSIENSMGRRNCHKGQGRVEIDLDIVVYDGEIKRRRDYESSWFQEVCKKGGIAPDNFGKY